MDYFTFDHDAPHTSFHIVTDSPYTQVAVDVPVYHPFTYRIPEALRGRIEPGHLVQIPFRNRSKTGLVMSVDDEISDDDLEDDQLKSVLDRVHDEPLVDAVGLEFLEFIAQYYLAPIGQVVRLALPSSIQLEGLKHYRLQDDHPPLDRLESTLRSAVEQLQSEGELPIESLKGHHGDLTYLQLATLEDEGFVEVDYHEESSGVGAKEETYYTLASSEGDGRRVGSKQSRILELLEGRERVSLSEIREHVDSPYSSLEGLADRSFIESHTEEVYRDPFETEPVPEPEDYDLTDAQDRALESILEARRADRYEGFVLHGVTGSGKTEVYIRTIRAALNDGDRALVLLPEIALTPQFVAAFRAHFGERIAVLHSGLTRGERFDEWRRIERDEVDIVIGARSAIFAPVSDLGVIVVDEEHDTSFKQERGPRYHARDMALVRGKLESAQVILGSATPSLESYHNAQSGQLTYLEMPERVDEAPMPDVEVVDMRARDEDDDSPSRVLSPTLHDALGSTLERDMQAILFLNRRGYSPCILCEECGYVFECPNCDVSLTYHRRQEALRCHHCDHSLRMPESCPQCGSSGLDKRGIGTEQLETHLGNLFGEAVVERLDRDTTTGSQLRTLIRRFRREEIDLLAGTQMVTKGHDFPGVLTVGVVLADLSLNFPDFRSAERTFQLLTQVSGRAGRGEERGRVYVQSYNPDHYSIRAASAHDYDAFAERELQLRKELAFPPHGHLIAVKFESERESEATQAARDYASAARTMLRRNDDLGQQVFMLGPAMAPLARLKGRARWQILLKSRERPPLRHLARRTLQTVGHFDNSQSRYRDVRIIVDVDPVNML